MAKTEMAKTENINFVPPPIESFADEMNVHEDHDGDEYSGNFVDALIVCRYLYSLSQTDISDDDQEMGDMRQDVLEALINSEDDSEDEVVRVSGRKALLAAYSDNADYLKSTFINHLPTAPLSSLSLIGDSSASDTKNRQRTMILSSRGVTSR